MAAESDGLKHKSDGQNQPSHGQEDALEKPIPLKLDEAPTALNYRSQPVNTDLPLSKEPLVQATDFGLSAESYYARTDGTNAPYNRNIPGALAQVWMRRTVAEKLTMVNELLSVRGLEVHLFDAFRPIETQQALWNHFIDMGRQQLKTSDQDRLRRFAGQFASEPTGFDPLDSQTWPTHNTGGAVDLTLRRKITGILVDMGSGFDDPTPRAFSDALERDATAHDQPARINRRILYNAMIKLGFANYPYEWWHFDYGTQMWLQNGGDGGTSTLAWYGPAILPRTT